MQKGQPHRAALLDFGAGEESRTLDLNLGKVALYQLSYSRLGAFGGEDGSRTRLDGFAGRCITALLPRQRELLPRQQRVTRCNLTFWSGRRVSNSRPQP